MPLAKARKLTRSFYHRETLVVARELIGKYIVYQTARGRLSARIVEVEAYIGEEDPACHAACGPTDRNRLMYGKPGVAYIYFIYGMYHCLNFVTERDGFPAAVLLRAAEPVEGVDHMRSGLSQQSEHALLSGPGKFCRGFGLSRKQNGLDLTRAELYLEDRYEAPPRVGTSKRIGIRRGAERPWRFFDADSVAVSNRARTGQRYSKRKVR
jgi:DNA-3-methyladenine glycosylase